MVLFSELKKSEKLRKKGEFSYIPQIAEIEKISFPQFPQNEEKRKIFLYSANCGKKEVSPIFRKLRKLKKSPFRNFRKMRKKGRFSYIPQIAEKRKFLLFSAK